MKISFDFDGTLSQDRVQRLADKLIHDGHDVIVVTSRHSKHKNPDVEGIADELGVEVFYTDGQDKYRTLVGQNVEIHYDDDPVEIELIEQHTHIIGILVSGEIEWRKDVY